MCPVSPLKSPLRKLTSELLGRQNLGDGGPAGFWSVAPTSSPPRDGLPGRPPDIAAVKAPGSKELDAVFDPEAGDAC